MKTPILITSTTAFMLLRPRPLPSAFVATTPKRRQFATGTLTDARLSDVATDLGRKLQHYTSLPNWADAKMRRRGGRLCQQGKYEDALPSSKGFQVHRHQAERRVIALSPFEHGCGSRSRVE